LFINGGHLNCVDTGIEMREE